MIVAFNAQLSKKLNRELNRIDITYLLDYFAIDIGLKAGENHLTVLFVCDEASQNIAYCTTPDILKELHGMSFDDQMGTYDMFAVQTKNIVGRKELFMNLLQLIMEQKKVNRVEVLPDGNEYVEDVAKYLNDNKGKSVTLMSIVEKDNEHFVTRNPSFALLTALGLKSEDI
jgi:hypothetical protein